MQHVNLEKAIMTNAKVIESDFKGAMMNAFQAAHSKWQNTILKGIEAKGLNFTESELDDLCKLDGANLANAILTKINAERVNFIGANMEGIHGEFAKLHGAILEGANLKFAKLEHAVLDQANAKGIDMTGANLTKASALSADFSKATMKDIEATKTNFKQANFTEADLRGSNLHGTVLTQVNMRRANLANAKLRDTDMRGADVEGAKVNKATDNVGAKVDTVKGEVVNEKNEKVSFKNHQLEQEKIDKARNVSTLGKICSQALDLFSRSAHKTAEFVKQPFSSRLCSIAGLATGAMIGIMFVPIMAVSGLVGAGVGVGIVACCAIAGTAAGHFAAKKCGLSATTVAGVAGTVVSGPIGTGVGFGAGVVVNTVVEKVTGNSIDGHLANGIDYVATGAHKLADGLGGNKEFQALLKKAEEAEKRYQRNVEITTYAPGIDKQAFLIQNKEAARVELVVQPLEVAKAAVKAIDVRAPGKHEQRLLEDRGPRIVGTAIN